MEDPLALRVVLKVGAADGAHNDYISTVIFCYN